MTTLVGQPVGNRVYRAPWHTEEITLPSGQKHHFELAVIFEHKDRGSHYSYSPPMDWSTARQGDQIELESSYNNTKHAPYECLGVLMVSDCDGSWHCQIQEQGRASERDFHTPRGKQQTLLYKMFLNLGKNTYEAMLTNKTITGYPKIRIKMQIYCENRDGKTWHQIGFANSRWNPNHIMQTKFDLPASELGAKGVSEERPRRE